jgi:hypothetical protein
VSGWRTTLTKKALIFYAIVLAPILINGPKYTRNMNAGFQTAMLQRTSHMDALIRIKRAVLAGR